MNVDNSQPQDTVVSSSVFRIHGNVKANLILPCSVTGNPPPTVTWYRRDIMLGSEFVLSDGTLALNVTEEGGIYATRDGVLYHCRASNKIGPHNFTATIRSRDVNVTYTCEHCV